jgi:purine nucleoside phosphorylase
MRMIVTNAAGGLNPEYVVGDIVLLNDVRQPRFLPTI